MTSQLHLQLWLRVTSHKPHSCMIVTKRDAKKSYNVMAYTWQCVTLRGALRHCMTLRNIAACLITQRHALWHCMALRDTVWHFTTLHYFAWHCVKLYDTPWRHIIDLFRVNFRFSRIRTAWSTSRDARRRSVERSTSFAPAPPRSPRASPASRCPPCSAAGSRSGICSW